MVTEAAERQDFTLSPEDIDVLQEAFYLRATKTFDELGMASFDTLAPGDIEALAKAMARIAADRELACRMGQDARRRVEHDYCLEVMARKVMNVYSEVLHSTGNVNPFQDAI